jgi:hypothetical protein
VGETPRCSAYFAQKHLNITKRGTFPVRRASGFASGTSHLGAVNQRWDLDFTTEAANVAFGPR